MFGTRIFWRLFLLILLMAFSSLAAFSWFASVSQRQIFLQSVENDLWARATLLESGVREAFAAPDPELYDVMCKEVGARTNTRFTLVLPSGRVIGDSDEDPSAMSNHADRPEIRVALSGERGVATRFSRTLEASLMYVAIPVFEREQVVGVVRASVPVDQIENTIELFYRRMAVGGVGVAVLAGLLSFLISRRFSRPLEEIYRSSQALVQGEAEWKLPVSDSLEIGGLAEVMNRMAVELDERLRAILRQRHELEAILSSMLEGILVVSAQGQVLRANRAATTMIGIEQDGLMAKPFSESIGHTALKSLIARTLSGTEMVEEDLAFGPNDTTYVEARGTPLRDSFERITGALIVLNDRTRLKRLMTLRRDFAAHVSHELKTPLTAIKGFADTLMQGALREPGDAERFVQLIAEQADRLHGVVESLMELARIERQAESGDVERSWHHVSDILEGAIASLENEGENEETEITVECPAGLAARVNGALLERAVRNLVDNAVRYGGPGCHVRLTVREAEEDIVIEVEDDGEGIADVDRDRIFERFYRASPSRARHPEGSGLGLAIVKHIALAHGGSIGVESTLGKGATFRMHIPKY